MDQVQGELIVSGKTTYLHVAGYLYLKKSKKGSTRYWECRRKGQCSARATTVEKDDILKVKKGKIFVIFERVL